MGCRVLGCCGRTLSFFLILVFGIFIFLSVIVYSYYATNVSEQWLSQPDRNLTLNYTSGIINFTAQVYNDTWLDFDGVDDYILADRSPIDYATSDFSFELWYYPIENSSDSKELVDSVYWGYDAFALTVKDNKLSAGIYNGSYIAKASSDDELFLNQWNHIVYVHNKTSGAGTLVQNNITQTGTTQPISSINGVKNAFGIRSNLATGPINASISKIRLYKKVLDEGEISALYQRQEINDTSSMGFGFHIRALETKSQHSMECIGDTLYIGGGLNSTTHTKTFYSFNITSKKVNTLANASIASQSGVLRHVNGRLFYILGLDSQVNILYNDTFEYNFSNNSWMVRSNYTLPREDMASGVVGDSIYIFGGRSYPISPLNSTKTALKYNTTTDVWSSISDMPDKKWSGDFGVAVGTKIYLLSSAYDLEDYPNLTTMSNVSWVYNTTDDTYSQIADIPLPVAYKEADYINDSIYIIGGAIAPDTQTATDYIQIYNMTSNTWSIFGSRFLFQSSGYMASSKCDDNRIYVSKGVSGSGYILSFGNFSDLIINYNLNENNGTSIHDLSGNGNNGTIYGATWQTDGILNTLVNATDYLLYPSLGIFELLNTFYDYVMIYFTYDVNSTSVSTNESAGGSSTTSSGSSLNVAISVPTDALKNEVGYVRKMIAGWSLEFDLTDSGGSSTQQHSLKVNSVGENKISITISSDPITIDLALNETKKINVDGDSDYDLSVYLKSLSGIYADIVLKEISEEIPVSVGEEEQVVSSDVKANENENENTSEEKNYSWIYFVVSIIIVLIISFLFWIVQKKKS